MKTKDIIDGILKREGGYVNNSADRGGPTKFGITRKTLQAWRGGLVTVNGVKSLGEDEARQIYEREYLVRPRIGEIKSISLRVFMLDSAVQHGPRRAIRWLQKIAGVPVDGIIGPVSLEAINRLDSAALYRKLVAERCRFYGRIITRDPTQAVFAAGWANRIAEFIEEQRDG